MNVSTLKNVADCSVFEDLRIGEWMSKAGPDSTEIIPKAVNPTIYEERRRLEVVRDELSGLKMQRLAPIVVVNQAMPRLWPRIGSP
jgi:hypothetical protein